MRWHPDLAACGDHVVQTRTCDSKAIYHGPFRNSFSRMLIQSLPAIAHMAVETGDIFSSNSSRTDGKGKKRANGLFIRRLMPE